MMTDNKNDASNKPNKEISVRDAFGIETDMVVKGFEEKSDRVPDIDETYKFDPDTTLAILAGFSHNRRCLLYTSPSPRDRQKSRMPSSA